MNAAATQRLMLELKRIRQRLDRLIELQEKQAPKKRARKRRKTPMSTSPPPPKPLATPEDYQEQAISEAIKGIQEIPVLPPSDELIAELKPLLKPPADIDQTEGI